MLPLPRQPESVCILRLSALGDATHVVPVVRAIQDHWPETRITWIVGKLEHRLLAGLDGVEFIEYDKTGGMTATRALHETLRKRRFDVLLHMQVAARANLLSCLVRAPVRVGWDRPRSRDLHHRFIRDSVSAVPFQHQVQGFLEFTRALGVPIRAPRWDLPISDEAHAWALEQLGDDDPVLLISPCSSHRLRNWKNDCYADVADHAAAERRSEPHDRSLSPGGHGLLCARASPTAGCRRRGGMLLQFLELAPEGGPGYPETGRGPGGVSAEAGQHPADVLVELEEGVFFQRQWFIPAKVKGRREAE